MFHGMTKSKLKFYKSGFILYIFDIIFEFVSSYFEKKKLSLTKKIPTITENNYNIIEQKFRKTYKNLKTIRPNNIPHARRTLEVNNITSLNHSYNKSITVTSCTNGNDSRTVSAVRFYRKQNATRLKVDSYPRKTTPLKPLLYVCVWMFFMCVCTKATYVNKWAVHVDGGLNLAHHVASRHGFVCLGKIGSLDGFYLFENNRVAKKSSHLSIRYRGLKSDAKVIWLRQQRSEERVKRGKFTDPMWGRMWYLNRKSSNMRVMGAWSRGYTGKGVVVTVIDDGVEHNHTDLAANYDPMASYDVVSNDTDPFPSADIKSHGTRCAGVVAAVANNRKCMVGVAYDAKIGGIRLLDVMMTDATEAEALSFRPNHIDIYSSSWGPEDNGKSLSGPVKLAKIALINGVKYGRKGKGSIYVWASGNGGLKDSCGCDGYVSSIYTLSVAGVSENGSKPWYLEECAAILASTYSSGDNHRERKIVTTDMRDTCGTSTGTSSSAAIASGMIALALQANPNLGWRDVQYIVILTSRTSPFKSPQWVSNGVGRLVSHRFGYGLMDGIAMVKLAEMWQNVPDQHVCYSEYQMHNVTFKNSKEVSLTSWGCGETNNTINYLEHVEVKVWLKAEKRGDLEIKLTSPNGTTSKLLNRRIFDSGESFKNWTLMTVFYWGENPVGEWKLGVVDTAESGSDVIFYGWRLILYGTNEQPIKITLEKSEDHNYDYIDEFIGEEDEEKQLNIINETLTGIIDQSDSSVSIGDDDATDPANLKCHKECAKDLCHGPGNTNCTSCRHYTLEPDGSCFRECPSGTYPNAATLRCYACPSMCRECVLMRNLRNADGLDADEDHHDDSGNNSRGHSIRNFNDDESASSDDDGSKKSNKDLDAKTNENKTENEVGKEDKKYKQKHIKHSTTFSNDQTTPVQNGPSHQPTPINFDFIEDDQSKLTSLDADQSMQSQLKQSLDDQGTYKLLTAETNNIESLKSKYLQSMQASHSNMRLMCTACPPALFLFVIPSTATCLKYCPVGYFPDTSEMKCFSCPEGCDTCQSSKVCTECRRGYELLGPHCLQVCPQSHFRGEDQSCYPCHKNCFSCSDAGESDCIICSKGLSWEMEKCVEKCSEGFYVVNMRNKVPICEMCDQSCRTCEGGNKNQCSSCNPSTFLHLNSCLRSCPQGFYEDKKWVCSKCRDDCVHCMGVEDGKCFECRSPKYLSKGTCVPTCPEGTFKVDIDMGTMKPVKRCDKCHESCRTCDFKSKYRCITCREGLFFSHGQCVQKCSPKEFQSGNTCIKCHISCESCDGESDRHCLSCERNKVLRGSACVNDCPVESIHKGNVCVFCPLGCDRCYDSTKCLKCSHGEVKTDGSCDFVMPNCPSQHFYDTLNRECLACHSSCASCEGRFSQNCTECGPEMVFQKGDCKKIQGSTTTTTTTTSTITTSTTSSTTTTPTSPLNKLVAKTSFSSVDIQKVTKPSTTTTDKKDKNPYHEIMKPNQNNLDNPEEPSSIVIIAIITASIISFILIFAFAICQIKSRKLMCFAMKGSYSTVPTISKNDTSRDSFRPIQR